MSIENQETLSILPEDSSSTLLKKSDLTLFKEEIYKLLRDTELKLSNQINNQKSNIDNDFSSFSTKINTVIENNKTMLLSIVAQKIKCERISELEAFKNKVDNMLVTHEIRIKTSIDEIEKIKTKYDKIISDNIYVPGYVGQSCQFPTLGKYINYNIEEVSKLRSEKEQIKKENKEIKNKIENLFKSMIAICDNNIIRCKEYADSKQIFYKNLLDDKLIEFNGNCSEVQNKFCKLEDDINLKIQEIMNEINKLFNMKNDFIDLIDNKFKCFKEMSDDLINKILINAKDIDVIKGNIKNIENNNKDFGLKFTDLSFKVRNYYTVNNKIAKAFQNLGVNVNNTLSIMNFLKKINKLDNIIGQLENIGIDQNLNAVKKNGNVAFILDRNKNNHQTTVEMDLSPKHIRRNSNSLQKKTYTINKTFTIKKEKQINKKYLSVKKENNTDNKTLSAKKENNNDNNISSTIKEKNIDNKEIQTENNNLKEEIIKTDPNIKNNSIKISDDESSSSNSSKLINKLDCDQNINIEENKLNNKNALTLENNSNRINNNDFIPNKTKMVHTEIISRNNRRIIPNDQNKLIKPINTITNKHSILKNKIQPNEKEIKHDNEMCKLVEINLKQNLSTVDDEIFKTSMITRILKKGKSNFIVKNGKLELPSSSLNTVKNIKFKKNSNLNKMITGYGEIPKKTGQAFGRTIETFYFNKQPICINNIYSRNRNECLNSRNVNY